MSRLPFLIVMSALVLACASPLEGLSDYKPVPAATVMAAPEPVASSSYQPGKVEHGKYLVNLLGCAACHTDGALIGAPRDDRLLAGSTIGLAHSNPLQVEYPAVVFPPNLTPDMETGIGKMTDSQIKLAIRHGVGRNGVVLKVMPIAALARLNDKDVESLVAYLRSLPPVPHAVPDAVFEGAETDALFVHFGVYQNRLQ